MNIREWKTWKLVLFLLLCLGMNYGGKRLAVQLAWPVWLDSLGTVLCAYLAGPLIGAMIGLTGNLIYAIVHHVAASAIYAVTSVALGLVIGICTRKWKLDNTVGVIKLVALTTLTAVAISIPLNFLFYAGMTGNIWGDAIIAFLEELGAPVWLAACAGQYGVDLLDKLVTILLLAAFLRGIRGLREKLPRRRKKIVTAAPEALGLLLAVSLLLSGAGCCLIPASAAAEEPATENEFVEYNNYVQTVYSSRNGLPCGEANDIAQTNDGILWVGTYAGLYRYNGQEFTWVNSESVRNVNCLYLDDEGRLWIGTNDNGLSIAIDEKITNVITMDQGLPSNSVRSIIQGADGYYYVGTTSSMQILNFSGGLKTVTTLSEINYADDSAADDQGHVAAVTSDGRLYLLQNGRILSSRHLAGSADVYRSCCFDEAGHLLAGSTGNEIYVYDISEGYFQELEIIPCDRLRNLKDLTLLENGELFISSDIGIGYLDTDRLYHFVNTNEFNASIDNMLVDYQGNLWFTSSRLGLLRMTPSDFRDIYASAGLGSQIVNTVVYWQNAFYIGTDKGLDIVDPAFSGRIENDFSEALSGLRIRCMMVDSRDHLWICTYGSGLMEASPDGQIRTYNKDNSGMGNRTRLVFELSNGDIMVGCDTGISFLRDHQVITTIGHTEGLINSMILSATELSDGRILVGTDGDGLALLREGKVERMILKGDGLSSEVILRTVADPKSDGVFLVTSNGLCYLRPDHSVLQLINAPYFNNYDIFFRDEDTMFVMSSAGIYVINRDEFLEGAEELAKNPPKSTEEIEIVTHELLDSRRGLNSSLTANSWNYADEAGNLYLSCNDGAFVLNVWNYASASHTYRMMISQIRANNEVLKADEDDSLTIDRNVSKLEIFPEIVNYTIQDPSVGYWLEGLDETWSIQPLSNLKSIVYTNLAAGDYLFHLAVFDADETGVIAERSWPVSKTRALYDSPLFFVYIFGLMILTIVWIMILVVYAPYKQRLEMSEKSIFAIANAVDARDTRTGGHARRVAVYSRQIAREMGMSAKDCNSIERAALLHDIGKIGIPDAVLNKPDRLTDEEYAIMKTHTTKGAEILQDLTFIPHVAEGARFHHERYDGRGYPNRLSGENIPKFARIIGVADAFDAMSANRIYRKQMDLDYVMNEMRKGRGTQFDPEADDAFMRLIEKGIIDVNKIYEDSQKPSAQGDGKEAART